MSELVIFLELIFEIFNHQFFYLKTSYAAAGDSANGTLVFPADHHLARLAVGRRPSRSGKWHMSKKFSLVLGQFSVTGLEIPESNPLAPCLSHIFSLPEYTVLEESQCNRCKGASESFQKNCDSKIHQTRERNRRSWLLVTFWRVGLTLIQLHSAILGG